MTDDRQRRLEEVRRASHQAQEQREQAAQPEAADETPPPRRRPSIFNVTAYESWIDRQIREGQERGLFDNLRGHGQPLAPDDQNVRAYAGDDALGLKILKDNEALPAWVELNKEVAAKRAHCLRILAYYETERDPDRRARFASDYRRKVADLNTTIDQYNLTVPATSLEQIRVRADVELRDADRRRWAKLD